MTRVSGLDKLLDYQQITEAWLSDLIDALDEVFADVDDIEVANLIELCDDDAQDVADTADSGTELSGSRCDHVHKGVSSIIAGTGIAVDQAEGDVTVTSEAEAPEDLEGDYSEYTLIKTINPTEAFRYIKNNSCFIDDETKIMVETYTRDLIIITIADGSYVDTGKDISNMGNDLYSSRSILGKYYIGVDDDYPRECYIYKNGELIQTITADDYDNDYLYHCLISPSGKYILFYWIDDSEAGNDEHKYLIYEGS